MNTTFKINRILKYWAFCEVPYLSDIYMDVYEYYEQISHYPNDSSASELLALAESAPDEKSFAMVCAGPLEDYINYLISKNKLQELQHFISYDIVNAAMQKKYIWVDYNKLPRMAQTRMQFKKYSDLSVSDLKLITGFFISLISAQISDELTAVYDKALAEFKVNKTLQNLLLDAIPDENIKNHAKNILLINDKT